MGNKETKSYKVQEEIEVSILDLTDEQIEDMSDEDTLDVLFTFKKMYLETEKMLKDCEKYSSNYKTKKEK